MGVEISSPPSLSSSSLSEFAKRWMLRRAFPPSLPQAQMGGSWCQKRWRKNDDDDFWRRLVSTGVYASGVRLRLVPIFFVGDFFPPLLVPHFGCQQLN